MVAGRVITRLPVGICRCKSAPDAFIENVLGEPPSARARVS